MLRKSESTSKDGGNGPSSGKIERTHKNEEQQIFYVGQKISGLDELEKLKAKYKEHYFCKLQKRDVRSLQAAAKCVTKLLKLLNHLLNIL